MALPSPSSLFDAAAASRGRTEMPTNLGTAELRELGAGVLARSVFTARGTSAIFTSELKRVVDEIASGTLGESQARAALAQCLDALGYTPEGGFPDAAGEVPPALSGTLQDLRSFRRLNLIVRTQTTLAQGAGQQWRGHQPERLAAFPAWELVRGEPRTAPREWPSRFVVSGGKIHQGRMIAFKGDPVWGELGSYDNFPDALGVDHPPFAFLSGMVWREVSAAECDALGVTGPNGESREVWFDSDIMVMAGKLPKLPKPRLSLAGVDPQIRETFEKATGAKAVPGKPAMVDFSDLLTAELGKADAAYQGGGGQ